MKRLFNKFREMYWCNVPFATLFILYKLRKQTKEEYKALVDIIDNDVDSDIANKLDKLHFRYNDAKCELIAVHQRATIVPNAIDAGTVTVDAALWMTEQLAEVEHRFAKFALEGKFECYPTYVDTIATDDYATPTDVIVFHLHPAIQNAADDVEQFVHANITVTVLYALLIAALTTIAMLLI